MLVQPEHIRLVAGKMSRGGVIVIAGCVSDPLFHQCLKLAKMLQDAGTAVHVDGGEMYETQFDDYLCKAKRKLGGNIFEVIHENLR